MTVRVLVGDALAVLRTLPSESVQCVVTSPPYLGLRSYGTTPQIWGGDPAHLHVWDTVPSPGSRTSDTKPGPLQHAGNTGRERLMSDLCSCGSWRGELGLEPEPSMFIDHLVTIFREVRRVLRSDGLCFVNIGNSYWTRSAMRSGGNREQIKAMAGEIVMPSWAEHAAQGRARYSSGHPTLKDKDLTLVPERFAIAMQDDGWWVRSCIAWCKTSAMPESVRDRPTSAWEHIWMFSNSARYWYDSEAVRQGFARERQPEANHWARNGADHLTGQDRSGTSQNGMANYSTNGQTGANLRNFWLLGPSPFADAHFATFPPEIPRRCILAGTSERGACPECGAGWTRRVDREPGFQARRQHENGTRGRRMGAALDADYRGVGITRFATLGWQPGCTCPPAPPIRQTVLDPFSGSGTTLMVADRLGRDAIGIELNESYADMSRKRISEDAGTLFGETVAVETPVQGELFGSEVAG